jgi:HAD superfamily hydrolase (TIGR01549 family)
MDDLGSPMTDIQNHPNNKVIFFDIDETLFDFRHASGAAIERVHAQFVHEHSLPLDFVKAAWWKACDTTAKDRIIRDESKPRPLEEQRKIMTKYGEELGLGYNYPTSPYVIDWCNLYTETFRENRRASEGAIDVLARLKQNGWRIVMISNGNGDQEIEKAKVIGVYSFADKFVSSRDGQGLKPDPRIFEFAATKIGIEVEEAFVVGQSLENDIKGAVRAGAAAVLYKPDATETLIEVEGFEVTVMNSLLQLVDVLSLP